MAAAKKGDAEAAAWDRAHRVGGGGGNAPPVALYTDHDPATSIKGCGFKDAATARRTLWLTGQPGGLYKQYWTVRAMAERAERHPAFGHAGSGAGMRAAAKVLRAWLEARRGALNSGAPPEAAADHAAQRANHAALVRSPANAHARRYCADEAAFAAHAKRDRAAALAQLRAGAAAPAGTPFALSAPQVVTIFGGPGEHGYGTHTCDEAAAAGRPAWACVCGFARRHTVRVAAAGAPAAENGAVTRDPAPLGLGKRFPYAAFTLTWRGETGRAAYSEAAGAGMKAPPLARFLQPRRGADPEEAAAIDVDAASSRSGSSAGAAPKKRRRE